METKGVTNEEITMPWGWGEKNNLSNCRKK
jgi:hypothetical protein